MPHGFDSPSPPFSLDFLHFNVLRRCRASRAPLPPFPKAVEWLDSSKPCWQSRSLFRAIVWPRRRSRPSRGTPPLRVYFGCSDWSVCVCVSMLYPSAIASQVGEVVYCVHTSFFVPRSAQPWTSPRISLSMAVCVSIPGQACGSMAGRLERDVPYSVRPPVRLPSGTADKGDGSSQIRTEGATSKRKGT